MDETAYYHCISRVVNREFVFGEVEREEFVRLMRVYERFCGVRVVGYCVMSNHFHVLVGIPPRPEVVPDDEGLLALAKPVFSPQEYGEMVRKLRLFRAEGAGGEAEALRAGVMRRMWDVSAFMKGLKQRFGGWFNRRVRRKGTLWEERFKSVLVEAGDALVTMAAYIDLNPLRAGMVGDPSEYRWCSYGAAMAGEKEALDGLREVMETWEGRKYPGNESLAAYREVLHGAGEEREGGANGESGRKGFSAERVKAVLASGGQLSRAELLRCRVRHFVDGAVIGSEKFVEGVFGQEKHRFGAARRRGGKPIQAMEGAPLQSLRDLKSGGVIYGDLCQ